MTTKISVQARVVGDRPEAGIGAVSITLPAPHLTGVELVRLAVEEQIRTLTARRALTAAELEQRLSRQYGAVVPGHAQRERRIGVPAPDVDQEVERALEACRARQCLVLIDGKLLDDLNQEIALLPETSVQFLRMMPLAGGQ
jgi:hypothetical protein